MEREPLLSRSLPGNKLIQSNYGGTTTKEEGLLYGVPSPQFTGPEHTILAWEKQVHKGAASHCHEYGTQEHKVDKKARRRLIIASLLCLSFMCAEIVGGIIANSLAIAADAAHMLTDFTSFMISIFALWVGSRPPSKHMTFGWYRAEVMGAVISVLLIWVVTAVLVYLAVMRIITNKYEIGGIAMVITASVGVLVNLVLGAVLYQAPPEEPDMENAENSTSDADSTGTLEQLENGALPTTNVDNTQCDVLEDGGKPMASEATMKKEKGKANINVRAAFIHVIGDFIQALGVLTAALLIYFRPDWKIADPICTFTFSVLVLFTTTAILRDTLNVLMEGHPRSMKYEDVRSCLLNVPGVKCIHHLRVWALTMNKVVVSAHLAIDTGADYREVVVAADKELRERLSVYESTLQVELYDVAMDTCVHCQPPK